jgi:hypothetical protein
MEQIIPVEINKEIILYELGLIYDTVKENIFFTHCSLKSIYSEKKNFLTPKHEIALCYYNFKTHIANYIKEVSCFD